MPINAFTSTLRSRLYTIIIKEFTDYLHKISRDGSLPLILGLEFLYENFTGPTHDQISQPQTSSE